VIVSQGNLGLSKKRQTEKPGTFILRNPSGPRSPATKLGGGGGEPFPARVCAADGHVKKSGWGGGGAETGEYKCKRGNK